MTPTPETSPKLTAPALPLLFIVAIGLSPWLMGGNFPRGLFPTPLAVVFGGILLLLPVTWLLLTRPVRITRGLGIGMLLWLVMTGYATLSLLWSYNRDATFEHLFPLLVAMSTALTVAAWGNAQRDRHRIVRALLAGVTAAGVYTLYQTFFGFGAVEQQLHAAGAAYRDIALAQSMTRGFGTLVGPNPMGGLLAISVPLAWYALLRSASRGMRGLWGAVILILVAGLFATGSRGALLIFFLEAAVILFISMRGRFRRLALYAGLAMVGGIVLYELLAWIILAENFTKSDPLLGRMLSLLSMKDISLISRLRYWETAVYTGLGLAPLGSGWGAFESVCRAFQQVPIFSRSPHGIFVSVFAELGFAGLLFVLAATLWPLWKFFRYFRQTRARGEHVDSLPAMAALAYTALLAHMCIDIDLEVPVLLMLLIVLGTLMQPSDDAGRPSLPASYRPPIAQALLGVFGLLIILVPAVFQGWEKTMTQRAVALQSVQVEDAETALQTRIAAVELYQTGLMVWPWDALARVSWINACRRLPQQAAAGICPGNPWEDLAEVRKAVPLHPGPVGLVLDGLMGAPDAAPQNIRAQCALAISLNPTSLDFYNVCRGWLLRNQQYWDAYQLQERVETLAQQYRDTLNPSKMPVYEALLINADAALMTCHPDEAREYLNTILTLHRQKYSTDSHLALTGPPMSSQKMAELARQRLKMIPGVNCVKKPAKQPSWWPYTSP